jgi:DNA invertase Pin-like site-specific DNA recombinase
MGLLLGYARVSTEKQALTHSLEHQKARLQASGVDVIYYDIASGKKLLGRSSIKVLALIE